MARTAWVAFYCGTTSKGMTASFGRTEQGWELERVASPSGQRQGPPDSGKGVALSGSMTVSARYGGCPGCGADSFVRCGECGRLSCWRSSVSEFRCGKCGAAGTVTEGLDELNAIDLG